LVNETTSDPVEILTEDHKKVRALFKRFEDATGDAKDEVFREIAMELEVHTKVEEEIFYPAVRMLPELEEMVGEAFEEHNIVDFILAAMKKLSPGEETYNYKFTTLKENVEHHAEEEEKEMFPKVRGKLGEIGERMTQRKQELKEQLSKRRSTRPRSRSTPSATRSRSGTRTGSRSRPTATSRSR
jgi:hemerythrin superfamily protein